MEFAKYTTVAFAYRAITSAAIVVSVFATMIVIL